MVPRRLHESPHIPPKICGIANTSNFGNSSHATHDDAVLVCVSLQDLNVEAIVSHAAFVHNNTHIVTGTADDCIEHSDSVSPITFQGSNIDVPLTMTKDVGRWTCHIVGSNVTSNSNLSEPAKLPTFSAHA